MKNHSDLALENFGAEASSGLCGHSKIYRGGFSIHTISVEGEQYHTVLCGRIWLSGQEERIRLLRLLTSLLHEFLPSRKRVLFVGIGNPDIAADSLGPTVGKRILVTGEAKTFPCVFSFCPSTAAQTGLDTAACVRLLAEECRADAIITADALSASSRDHLAAVIQIGTGGLRPGSALTHTTTEISSRTMPCPVVSIGVPTVISTEILTDTQDDDPLLVTRPECGRITDCYASVIAGAVNTALFGK